MRQFLRVPSLVSSLVLGRFIFTRDYGNRKAFASHRYSDRYSWLLSPQITHTRIRARGSAIRYVLIEFVSDSTGLMLNIFSRSSFFNWICVFAVVEMTPPAIDNISWRVFIIFAILNALWVPLVYAFFPETKGLELEDIDHIFEKGGITGGVWEARKNGGVTVERNRTRRDLEVLENEKDQGAVYEKGVE